MELDKSQKKIVNASDKNICVIAGAGSGKTRVLTERVAKLLNDGVDPHSMVCITFTRMAAQEMRNRFKNIPNADKMFIGTIHSFANQIYRNTGIRFQLLTPEKETSIMKYLIKKYAKHLTLESFDEYCKGKYLVNIGRLKKKEIENILTDEQEAERRIFCDGPNIKYLYENKNTMTEDELAKAVILEEMITKQSKDYPETVRSIAAKENIITFNALLDKCTQVLKSQNRKIEYLFVDEFQDIGVFEYRFLLGLNADHVFVVGDDYQCQPAGTKVTAFDGKQIPIEDIQVGTPVVTYNNSQYLKWTNKWKYKYAAKVQNISRHTVSKVYKIYTEDGKKTQYTYNHKCYTSLNPDCNLYSLCLLKNSQGWYRLDVIKAIYGFKKQLGLTVLMRQQKATEGWILQLYSSEKEARNALHKIVINYGISYISWHRNKHKNNIKSITALYENQGDLTLQVAECLKTFGRSIHYPYRRINDNKHMTSKWMFELEACNLISNLNELYIPDKIRHHKTKITKILINYGEFEVYGLDVSKYHNYIADGILTHNSIYGFKGADFEYFKAISSNPEFKTYKLNNNYRCSSKIVNYSNKVIDTIDDVIQKNCVSKTRPLFSQIIKDEGGLRVVEKYAKVIDPRDYGKWFFLTRNNDDVTDITRMLYRNNIPYMTFKQSNLNPQELADAMNNNSVKVLTIHASKGLESDNVLMYGAFPDIDDITSEFIENRGTEHIRIMYVGITRAKNNLVIVNKPYNKKD